MDKAIMHSDRKPKTAQAAFDDACRVQYNHGCMDTVFIGQGPSRKACFRRNVPSFLEKLSARFGIPELKSFDFFNLLDTWYGKCGKGDVFPLPIARAAARKIDLSNWRRIVLVGKNVAKAFGVRDARYLQWQDIGGARLAVFPHPSGVNRWWNDRENTERAHAFLVGLCRQADSGENESMTVRQGRNDDGDDENRGR